MKKIRSKRRSRQTASAARMIALIAFAGLVAYLAAATSVGTFVAKNIVAPLFTSLGSSEASVSPSPDATATGALSLSPLPTDDGSPSATADLTTGALQFFALQMGAFENSDNAESFAQEVRQRAGGGYVQEDDGLYRVYAAVYRSKDDARAVKEQLLSENGMESSIRQIDIPALSLRVTATETQLSAVTNGFALLERLCTELYDLCVSYESGESTAEQTADALNEYAQQCDDCAAALPTESGGAAQSLHDALIGLSDALRDAVISSSQNQLEFCAALKYTHIVSVCRYAELVHSITG